MTPRELSTRIVSKLRRKGLQCSPYYAESGSVYIKVDGAVMIRVSDHCECYPPERGERRLLVMDMDGARDAIAACLHEEFPFNVPAYRPAPPTALDKAQSKHWTEKEAEQKAKDSEWAAAARARVTIAVPADVLATVQNRPAARAVALRYGLRPAQVWTAATGKKWK